jgi:hypothetical protein
MHLPDGDRIFLVSPCRFPLDIELIKRTAGISRQFDHPAYCILCIHLISPFLFRPDALAPRSYMEIGKISRRL